MEKINLISLLSLMDVDERVQVYGDNSYVFDGGSVAECVSMVEDEKLERVVKGLYRSIFNYIVIEI